MCKGGLARPGRPRCASGDIRSCRWGSRRGGHSLSFTRSASGASQGLCRSLYCTVEPAGGGGGRARAAKGHLHSCSRWRWLSARDRARALPAGSSKWYTGCKRLLCVQPFPCRLRLAQARHPRHPSIDATPRHRCLLGHTSKTPSDSTNGAARIPRPARSRLGGRRAAAVEPALHHGPVRGPVDGAAAADAAAAAAAIPTAAAVAADAAGAQRGGHTARHPACQQRRRLTGGPSDALRHGHWRWAAFHEPQRKAAATAAGAAAAGATAPVAARLPQPAASVPAAAFGAPANRRTGHANGVSDTPAAAVPAAANDGGGGAGRGRGRWRR